MNEAAAAAVVVHIPLESLSAKFAIEVAAAVIAKLEDGGTVAAHRRRHRPARARARALAQVQVLTQIPNISTDRAWEVI